MITKLRTNSIIEVDYIYKCILLSTAQKNRETKFNFNMENTTSNVF